MAKYSIGQYFQGALASVIEITSIGIIDSSGQHYNVLLIKAPDAPENVGKTVDVLETTIDAYYTLTTYNPSSGSTSGGFNISGWLPMSPDKGPPLPLVWGIYWPWYKG